MPDYHQGPLKAVSRPLGNLVMLALMLLMVVGCASSPNVPERQRSSAVVYGAPAAKDDVRVSRLQQVYDRYEGTPYRYGGTTARGFDCSGFIGRAYQEAFGMELPRTTTALLNQGTPISPRELEPGDLVFFEIRGKEQHAGIFIGGDDFIHASTSVGVTRSSLNGYYWRDRFTQARRFD